MISVAIFINNENIGDVTCHRIKEPDKDGNATYKILDGTKTLKHNPDDGAVTLAKKMLDELNPEEILREKLMKVLNEK